MSIRDELGPIGYGNFDVEPFDKYKKRVSHIWHNVPDCVLEQLFHRHWSDLISEWEWLGLNKLEFKLTEWDTHRIVKDVRTHKGDCVDSWSKAFIKLLGFRETWLGKYMLMNGTWPNPIIVLINDINLSLPNGIKLKEPYNLFEGHHRLAYLKAMSELKSNSLLEVHKVWLVTVNKDAVSNTW